MSKHNYKKSRLKFIFLAFTCAATFAFSGLASACGNKNDSPDDEDKEQTAVKEDTQLLKNGNFEFFTIPEKQEDGNEPEYLIKSPTNWSHGGTTSYTMSGIISTSKTAWDKMVADSLAETLDYNNKLDSSSSDYLSEYVDYNGMKSSDILYKNQYEALRDKDDYKDDEEIPEDRKDRIENPGTHYSVHEKGGKTYAYVDGEEVPVYVNDDGEYFLEYDEDKDEYSKPISNILMLHNYATSHNGIAQNYSSVSVELPANTAAEVTVWVKTAYLKFSQGKEVTQDRGANITVTQRLGSTSIDDFVISCINTEKLISEGKLDDTNNGWAQYTVYINACDFASTTIEIELGLGETGYTTEGYAFFDDVSVKKYVSLDKSESFNKNKDKLADTTCNLSSDESEKIYKADSYQRNDNPVDDRYSNNFHYLIDLASELSDGTDNSYHPIVFDVNNEDLGLNAGLTVDRNNYVSSNPDLFNGKNGIGGVEYKNWRLPFSSSLLKESGLITSSDYINVVKSNYKFKSADTEYYEKLNDELNGAANLPKNSDNNDMIVMLSAYGAAYTTSFTLSVPRVGADNGTGGEYEGYQIISFWVKTSNLGGSTAATLRLTQEDNDDNVTSFSIDTTNIVTDIGDEDDEKDIYDGWVQCFFYVKNELEADDEKTYDNYTVEFCFGNTTIKGTDVYSYKSGWVALANMQYLNVDEDIFSYTGSGSYTASLTISEEAEKHTQAFDSAYANQSHEIKNDMVIPASYTGVNGGSSAVVNNGHVSIPFDEFNNNVDDNGDKFTGLINQEHFGNYEEKNLAWYNELLDNFNASGLDAMDAWTKIFGPKSVQPLIISNRMRTSYVEEKGANENNYKDYYIKNEDGVFELVKDIEDTPDFDENETYYSLKQVMNYGYIGSNSTVSSNSYATISVRVRASKNAIAYVYLVDTSAGKNTLSFSAPTYSFYYDEEGNVLKGEPKKNASLAEQRENILYTLRDDGLYEDKDGKLYANTWNYSKLYYLEDITYYDKDGNPYSIEDLVDGETYYDSANTATRKIVNHYLVSDSGIKLYQYIDGNYYYIVLGKTQEDIVNPFDISYKRYDFGEGISEDYVVAIDGSEHDDWVTVTFVIHAGSKAKSYRLELWSGKREETQTVGNEERGMVLFDYSYTNISDDSLKGYYEDKIINEYLIALNQIDGALDGIPTAGKNIKYFEDLAKNYEDQISIRPYGYKAHYYTFSWYDSSDFVPFNGTVVDDGTTGYIYNATEQTETLAYLQIQHDDEYYVFADYSEIEKTISLDTPPAEEEEPEGEGEGEGEEEKKSDGSVWLLASSIILVIALIFAIIAIFFKDAIKKMRRNKVTSKNNYDQRRANRYKRKLNLKQEVIEEVDSLSDSSEKEPVAQDKSDIVDALDEVEIPTAEEPTAEATAEETVETPAVEEPTTETPAEEAVEAPQEQPADGEDKPE